MRIVIIGKAGCGKTTIANMFKSLPKFTVISCDDYIHAIYNSLSIHGEPKDFLSYLKRYFKECVINGKFNKEKLAEIIIKDSKKRKILENYFYNNMFKKIAMQDNIIVDGLLPRFTKKGFDIVLYAYVDDKERRKRLLKRGMPQKRIEEIDKIQKDWYKELK